MQWNTDIFYVARYLEYVCIPLHSYHRKRNKNAVQSLFEANSKTSTISV